MSANAYIERLKPAAASLRAVALLVLLLVASAFFTQRAISSGRTRELLLAGVVVGLAFMTKMLQGWMVVPALGAAYLLAGPPRLRVRVGQLAGAYATMLAVSAAWPLAVTLWPGSKPYIGGSTNGSVWNLILGYNGFGRLTGNENGGAGGGASFGGTGGLWRMFNEQVGGQIAWLLPLAAVSLVAGLWLTRRAPRTDARRAAWVLFGVWALVHVAVFSGAKGIFHPYYVSALAPAVAALAGAGIVTLWRWARTSWTGLVVLDATVAGTAWLAVDLLGRTPGFSPALRTLIPAAALVAIAASTGLRTGGHLGRRLTVVAAIAGTFAILGGPAAFSKANLDRALNGNNVIAGPASGARGGMGPMGGIRGGGSGPGGSAGSATGRPSGTPPMGAATVDTTLLNYLVAHQGSATYLVAASGSQATAPIILATGKPVVTIGGFNGGDPAPTVAQLAKLVSSGRLKFVLLGSGGTMGAPGGSSSAITAWVRAHGTIVSAAGTRGGTLYAVSAS